MIAHRLGWLDRFPPAVPESDSRVERLLGSLRDGWATRASLAPSRRLAIAFGIALVASACGRLWFMAWLPLLGSTEGRYAGSAMDVVMRGVWLPHRVAVDSDWPDAIGESQDGLWRDYLGKPPLAIWLSALAMKLAGLSELAARLPSFLAGILWVWLLFLAARALYDSVTGYLTAFVAATCMYLLGCSGVVMLDLYASLPASVAIVALVRRERSPSRVARRLWGYAPFLALALGMLAKGPITILFALLPIAAYVVLRAYPKNPAWRRPAASARCCVGPPRRIPPPIRLRRPFLPRALSLGLGPTAGFLGQALSRRWDLLRGWPYFSGSLIFLGIAVPWFWLAEVENPGFLRYFVVEEHLRRFFDPDFRDPFGNPHRQPLGLVWVHWLCCWVPWQCLLIAFPLRSWAYFRNLLARRDSWGWLFLFTALVPPLIFTPSRSITAPYPLPAVGGIALLLGPLLAGIVARPVDATRAGVALAAPFLVALLVGCYRSLVWDLSPWLGAGMAASTVVYAGLAWRSLRRTRPLAFLYLVPLGWFLAMTMVFTSFAGRMSYLTGTRDVMAAALSKVGPGEEVTIVRRWEPPMAFYAWGRTQYVADFRSPDFEREVRDGERDIYVFRSKYARDIPAHLAPLVHAVAEVGFYSIFSDSRERLHGWRPIPARTAHLLWGDRS